MARLTEAEKQTFVDSYERKTGEDAVAAFRALVRTDAPDHVSFIGCRNGLAKEVLAEYDRMAAVLDETNTLCHRLLDEVGNPDNLRGVHQLVGELAVRALGKG